MKLKTKKCLYTALAIMFVFFVMQTLVVLDILEHSKNLIYFNYLCIILFSPLFYVVVKEYISNSKEINRINKYTERLSATLISQSNNTLFYEGKVTEGAKLLTSEVTKTMGVDRCSIWLYDENKTSITCEQLYIKSTDSWQEDMILKKQDFEPYFRALIDDPIIIANDAEIHPATKCFTDSYLKPIGIKSMLDVPIIYKGDIVGVICIENLTKRDWLDV